MDLTAALIMDFLAVDENRQMVAEVLWPAFFDQQRPQMLSETKDNAKTRWLLNGADITSNQAGTQVAARGESYADRVNIVGGSAYWSNKPESRQLNLSLGAGADCLFDYLVSSCFASVTGFTEGQTFPTLSGCTFKGYSTIQGACTAIGSASTNSVLAICGGTYSEQVTLNPPSGINVDVLGCGSGRVNWATSGNSQTLLTIGTLSNGSRVTVKSVHFNLGTNTSCTGITNTSNYLGKLVDCHFTTGGATSSIGVNITNGLGLIVDECSWSGSGKGLGGSGTTQLVTINGGVMACATGLDITGNRVQCTGVIFKCTTADVAFGTAVEITFAGCEFNKGCNTANATTLTNVCFSGGTMRIGSGDIGIDFSGISSNSHGFMVSGLSMKGTGTAIGIKLATTMIDGMIGPNDFNGFTSGNEISGTGGGVTGAHNVSNAGAIADFGSPVGHSSLGTGTAAPSSEAFVTIGNSANLSAERALTAGTGITITDAGANSTVTVAAQAAAATFVLGDATVTAGLANYEVLTQGNGIGVTQNSGTHLATVALGNLTGNWSPTGAFNITTLGTQSGTAQIASGLTGATSGSRYVGGTTSGAPVTGTFNVGDFVIAQNAHIWVCTVAGSPGTWVDVSASSTANTSHELIWFSQTPVTGDNLAYIPIQFNGSGATAVTPLRVRAKDYGYGTTTINLLRAPNGATVAAAGGLPNPAFATILTSDLNIESSHITMTGIEDVTITGGALSGTTLALDDVIRTNVDSVNNMVGMTVELTVTI